METNETTLNETTTGTTATTEKTEQPKNLLFGTIAYNDESSYEKFIHNMNLSQAIFVLIASANFSQSQGAFNILESETISTAIRTVRKNSTPTEQPTTNTEN
jgi:hypothetical protein